MSLIIRALKIKSLWKFKKYFGEDVFPFVQWYLPPIKTRSFLGTLLCISSVRGILTSMLGALLLTGCEPRDVQVKTMAETLESGEAYVLQVKGERSPSCAANKADWDELRLQAEYFAPAVLGQNQVVTQAGTLNCLRVGSIVNLSVNREIKGQALVEKVVFIKLKDFLANQDRFLNDQKVLRGVKISMLNQKTYDDLEGSLEPRDRGAIQFTVFKYIKGSSGDEEKILNQSSYEIVDVPGGKLSSCTSSKPWTSLDVPLEFQPFIFEKGLRTWVSTGALNCLEVQPDKEIDLKVFNRNPTICAKVKVLALERMPYSQLKESALELGEVKFNDILEYLQNRMQKKPQSEVTLTHFEFVEGSQFENGQLIDCEEAK